MTHFTENAFHLGDNLLHLHFLRALAKQNPTDNFHHYVHECHIGQLREVVEDLPQIQLFDYEQKPPVAINCWKNYQDIWVESKLRWDWSAFHLAFFNHLSGVLGLNNPFHRREDLLFDYPALHKISNSSDRMFDFLIINSRPCSGQMMQYTKLSYMDGLIAALVKKGHRVVVTQACSVEPVSTTWELAPTIAAIGNLSMRCKHMIAVATGPLWSCLNTTNHHYHEGRSQIVMLSNGESLNMPHVTQLNDVEAVTDYAREKGWI